MRKTDLEGSRNPNREVWESSPFYGGEDVKDTLPQTLFGSQGDRSSLSKMTEDDRAQKVQFATSHPP
ncbi:MAG: hypothetical protein ACRC62_34445 [Microcoleus sp.]